jgi:hypothetical protein
MWILCVSLLIYLLFDMGAGFINLLSQDSDFDGWFYLLNLLWEIWRAFSG